MKQTKNKQIKPNMSETQVKRFSEAKVSYDKLFQEIAPFVSKTKAKEVSTEGKWQSNSSLSFY